jgi:glycosyltransferase involved in cell wall biosynthesis
VKVLQVIPSVGPNRGGPTEIIFNLVRELKHCGVDTEIVTTNDNVRDLLDVPLNQKIEYEGVSVRFFPRFSGSVKGLRLGTDRGFVFSAELAHWLWQHSRDYDILHTHYLFSFAPTCAAAIARQKKIPYIVTPYGMLTAWALAHQRLKKQIYSIIERHNLNQAVAIHCSTPGELQDVCNYQVSNPSFVIPYGVHLQPLQPQAKQHLHRAYGIPDTTPIVLFLSRLHPKKRPDLLLEALHQLASLNHDFHLILAGSGEPDYLSYLSNLISSLGLQSQTSMTGFVTGKDKDLLLQGSDLFVLPSFSENFGIAIAEAMAAGLPVIITPDVQIAPDIAAETAGLIVEGEVDALRGAIAQLLTSPDLRHQLGENGKRLVSRRYCWSAIASNLSHVYRSIVNQQPLPQSLAFD